MFTNLSLLDIPLCSFSIAVIHWETVIPSVGGGILLLCLLSMSALISGSEVAFFSLTPKALEQLKHRQAKSSKIVLQLLEHPKELLATILIANNFINVGTIVLSTYLSNLFFLSLTSSLKLLINVVVITFFLLLFGEIIPKIYATKNGVRLSLLMAKPLFFIGKTPPFSWLKNGLVKGTAVISKMGKLKSHPISTDELTQAVELTVGESDHQQDKKIWRDIVRFGEKDVKQIMKPRVDVEAIESTLGFRSLCSQLTASRFSRIPVYKDNFDDVKGILFIKDVLPFLDEGDNFLWQELIKETFFVPENKKIDDLMNDFQELKTHIAIVVDEYGGTSGIVTLEDVLEEIVGDITDEFDEEDLTYSKLDDHNYIFEGKTNLVDIYKILEIEGDEFKAARSESDTLAGFVIEQAGKLLKNGESIRFLNYTLRVESADARKIKRIKLTINEPNTTQEK